MQTIGRYQLLDTLGQGGMGVVYRAFDTLLERTVAVKVIGAQIDSNPEIRARFFREARAAGQLSHKNIVTIYDLGEQDGHPFLAMEYLEGEDLQQRLSGPVKMSVGRKLDLAIEICEGLEYAHAHGVVHRDVKPANIFITTAGQLKIMDFGLARLMTSQLTNSNMLMGTLNYMAPEQVRGDRADHRSDVFSVGVVLYELLGNKKAFEGDSFASTMYKILQEVPEPLWQVDGTVPRALAAIVEHALAKPLDERHQSMSALRQDLLGYRDHLRMIGSDATPAPVRAASSPEPEIVVAPGPLAAGSGATPHSPASADVPAGPTRPTSPRGFGYSRQSAVGALAVVLAVGSGTWFVMHRRTPAPAVTDRVEQATGPRADTSDALARAEQAFQSNDYAAAGQQAQLVLRQRPGDAKAQGILDRARTAVSVENAIQRARTSLAAGDFQSASRLAGGVLTLSPDHAEAKQIVQQGATRSGERSAADARLRMMRARAQAREADAPVLAAPAYRSATRAEQAAQRLLDADRTADATARFYDASGLYQGAASLAEAQRAKRSEPDAPPAAAPPPPPAPSHTGKSAEPSVPPARPPAPEPQPSLPAPTAAAPPPVAVAGPEDPASHTASPEQGITELLAHYTAALEGKDLDRLKKLWPGLSEASANAIRNDFQNASRLTVDVLEPRITASGAHGTVTFRRRYELHTRDGQRLRTETQTTMTVRRTPAGWIIEVVRFSPAR